MFADPVDQLLAEARRSPLLSADEEVSLARRAERGDPAARERLITSNIRLVVSVARRYQGHGLPLADLVQEGMLGLIRAVDGFDWRKGFRFSTYGTIWIRKYVQRSLETAGDSVRKPVTLVRRARRVTLAERELGLRLGRTPTEEEVARAAGLTADQLHEVRISEQSTLALDRPVTEDAATSVADLLVADDPGPEAHVTARAQTRALAAAIASLPDHERAIIAARFGTEGRISLHQAGAAIGRSAERARQIEEQALRRLASHRELAPLGAR
jgi:RNA polymerase primary sigma factor